MNTPEREPSASISKLADSDQRQSQSKRSQMTEIFSANFDPDEMGNSASPSRSINSGPPLESAMRRSTSERYPSSKRVTLLSDDQGSQHWEGHDTRSSSVMRKRSTRRVTDITFDIVVEKDLEPDFIEGLHDLTQDKTEAHEILVKDLSPEEDEEDKPVFLRPKKGGKNRPWRRAKNQGLFLDEWEEQKKLGVQLGSKLWVPRTINPVEIDLKKFHKKEIKDFYEIMEDPRDGLISIDDLGSIIRACGSEPNPELLEEIIKKIEPTSPGYLTLDELEEIVQMKLEEEDPIEEIERAFKKMSLRNEGRVSLEDLREVSRLVDYPLNDEELREMINAAHPTANGEATLGGFVRLITTPSWFDNAKKSKPKKEKRSVFKLERVYRKFPSK